MPTTKEREVGIAIKKMVVAKCASFGGSLD